MSGGFVPGNTKPYIPRYFGALWFAGLVTGSRPPVLFHRADGRTRLFVRVYRKFYDNNENGDILQDIAALVLS